MGILINIPLKNIQFPSLSESKSPRRKPGHLYFLKAFLGIMILAKF